MVWGLCGEWMVADFNRNPELFPPPSPDPFPHKEGRGDSKRDVGTWSVFELLGLILARGRLRIFWERQSVFFP